MPVLGCRDGQRSSVWWPAVTGVRRRGRSLVGVLVAGLAAVTGCGGSAGADPVVTVTSTVAAAGVLTASPAFGTTDLPPSQPVTIGVANGALDTVSMIAADGVPVAGTISADRGTWTPGEPLRFAQTYTVTGSATGADGGTVPISGTWSTVPDTAAVRNTVYPGDDAVVGVAAPVTVYFGVEPVDKAAVAARVTLTSDPAGRGRGRGSGTTTAGGRWTTAPGSTGRPGPGCTSPPACSGCRWRRVATARRTSPVIS